MNKVKSKEFGLSNHLVPNDVVKFVNFYQSDFGRRIIKLEAEYINLELSGYSRILDVGCGIGIFESYLPQLNIVGLDSSKYMLYEAKRRGRGEYILGNAEELGFKGFSFDAILYVTTLEFLSNYKRAIREGYRVLRSKGKLLALILNPVSKYFQEHISREGSYFRRVKHRRLKEIEDYILNLFTVDTEYFLGIDGENIFDTQNTETASLYVIKGERK
jgi:ubiquinone/menaquinone biosynthesis C-methylase UbiE